MKKLIKNGTIEEVMIIIIMEEEKNIKINGIAVDIENISEETIISGIIMTMIDIINIVGGEIIEEWRDSYYYDRDY